MGVIVMIPIPKEGFSITGSGHDMVRLTEACKQKMKLMEQNYQDPRDLVTVDVPPEDDTL
jgi:hypothetical protein